MLSWSCAVTLKIERYLDANELARDLDELNQLVHQLDDAEAALLRKTNAMREIYGVDVVVQRVSARHGLRPLFSFVPNPSMRRK